MTDLWYKAADFIDGVLGHGGCVAVHCAQGAAGPRAMVLSFFLGCSGFISFLSI